MRHKFRYILHISIVLIGALQLIALFNYGTNMEGRKRELRNITEVVEQIEKEKNFVIETARGAFTYRELEETVFKMYGYRIAECTYPIPTLKRIKIRNCAETFSEWKNRNKVINKSFRPLKSIPLNLWNLTTMNGHAVYKEWYLDERHGAVEELWNSTEIDVNIISHPFSLTNYGIEGRSVHWSTLLNSVVDQLGMVVGSITPWVETICLRNGAKKVITVEYRKIITDHPQIIYYHPLEFMNVWESWVGKLDFVVSYSSIEHSGLGRYGDTFDPLGDLKEIDKIRCLLKRGGRFHFGVGYGKDALFFNAHRVYGQIRLAMVFEGFRLIDTYIGEKRFGVPLTEKQFKEVEHDFQMIFVLEKI